VPYSIMALPGPDTAVKGSAGRAGRTRYLYEGGLRSFRIEAGLSAADIRVVSYGDPLRLRSRDWQQGGDRPAIEGSCKHEKLTPYYL
jgi:hypothetical protein